MSSFWIRSTKVLFSDDAVLRVRASMAALAVALMAASTAIMFWLASYGFAAMAHIVWWAGISLGGMVVMALMVRLRITEQWRDPALTFPQILWAVSSSAVAYVLLHDAKGVVPGLLAITLLFAALNLRARQIVAAAIYALAVFSAAVLTSIALEHNTDPALEVAYACVLLVMLLGCMLLSLRLYQLRVRLRQQRQELRRALSINKELASRDPLTGLINRRHMLELLHLEQRRSMRNARHLILAQMDIDYFKSINDTYGHAVGDLALQTFADCVRENIRNADIISRWGGEEFVLLLSDTDLPGALHTLNRVRNAVAQASIPHGPSALRMTVSIGLAQHMPGESIESTLERADKALYRAKRAGRNQVVIAPLPQPQPEVQAVPASLGGGYAQSSLFTDTETAEDHS